MSLCVVVQLLTPIQPMLHRILILNQPNVALRVEALTNLIPLALLRIHIFYKLYVALRVEVINRPNSVI